MKIIDIIQHYSEKKILVIGDIILDTYLWCSVDRISPEAPVPIAKLTEVKHILGGAANVANNLAAYGIQARLLGGIGTDHAGDRVQKMLKQKGIDAIGVLKTKKPTILKNRIMANNQQLLRLDQEDTSAISSETEKQALSTLSASLEGVDAVILSDYQKGFITEKIAQYAIQKCNLRRIPILVDPKPKNIHKFKYATLVKPNKQAAEQIAKQNFTKNYSNVGKIGSSIQEELHANLIITLGADGMAIFNGKKKGIIKTAAKEVYDVSGAGDTTIATLAASLSAGATLEQAAIISNFAAGIVVGKLGTATCSLRELIEKIENQA